MYQTYGYQPDVYETYVVGTTGLVFVNLNPPIVPPKKDFFHAYSRPFCYFLGALAVFDKITLDCSKTLCVQSHQ